MVTMMDYTTRLTEMHWSDMLYISRSTGATLSEKTKHRFRIYDLHTKLRWIFRMIWNTLTQRRKPVHKGPSVKISQLAHLSSSLTSKNWSYIYIKINCIICVHWEFAHNPVSPTPFGFHISARAHTKCKEQLTTTGTTRHIMNVLTYTFSPYVPCWCVLYYICMCVETTPAAQCTHGSRIQWENASLTGSLSLLPRQATWCAPNATKIAKADGDLDARVSSCGATWSQFGKWHRGEFSWPWYLLRRAEIPFCVKMCDARIAFLRPRIQVKMEITYIEIGFWNISNQQ